MFGDPADRVAVLHVWTTHDMPEIPALHPDAAALWALRSADRPDPAAAAIDGLASAAGSSPGQEPAALRAVSEIVERLTG